MEEGDIYIHILYIWMNKFCIYGRERFQYPYIEYMDETILYKWKCDIYTFILNIWMRHHQLLQCENCSA